VWGEEGKDGARGEIEGGVRVSGMRVRLSVG